MPLSETRHAGHEGSEIRIKGFVIFLICFVLSGAIIGAVVRWIHLRSPRPKGERSPVAAAPTEHQVPPKPVQQGSAAHPELPFEDLARMRNEEDRILNSYSWVDRSAGTVLIPIDRAMVLLVQRGLPTTRPGGG